MAAMSAPSASSAPAAAPAAVPSPVELCATLGAAALPVSAHLAGERLDVRALAARSLEGWPATTLRAGERGLAMVFRYGAVVAFGVEPGELRRLLDELAPHTSHPLAVPELESARLRLDAAASEGVEPDGTLVLARVDPGRLAVLAHVLAKSVVLADQERRVSEAFDAIEPLADRLRAGRAASSRARDLLRQVGEVLRMRTRTVGRVEVDVKPEVAWDDPALDRLYERLAVEYELRDRDVALTRKLDLIGDAAATSLDVLQNRQTLRVEWYIVILIVVEIVLSLVRD
jgi:uncharacterized Rmd1/YagE family protein